MPFHVGQIANRVLDLADQNDVGVTPMKLQKLVYLAHGWHLGILDEPLIDAVVEAWKYGPVVSDLYHEFKGCGKNPIHGDRYTKAIRREDGKWKLVRYKLPAADQQHAQNAHDVIDRVWEVYGQLTGPQLSSLTHQPGTPWSETWNGMGDAKRRGKDIPEQLIRSHFKELARQAEQVG